MSDRLFFFSASSARSRLRSITISSPFSSCPPTALLANLAHAIVLRKLGRSFGYALASFLLIAANLAIFFLWTLPTNQATNNWTIVPKNWNELRIQWEYSHAANAVVTFAALVCVVIAVLRQPSQAR